MKSSGQQVVPREVLGPRIDESLNLHFLDGLARFLGVKGNTLLIKGYAGAGKTTLAVQLLQGLSGEEGGLYISSRVSQDKVSRYLPIVGDQMISDKKIRFLDIRMGTSSSIIDELTRAIFPKKGAAKPSVIVLDTWDALAKEMDDKERLKAEKMVIALADSSRTRMIFVSEEPGRTTMDYLVDGIVELVRREQDDRIFREVEVQKLRGTMVDQHKYLYTLYGGVFRHLPPYVPPTHAMAKKFTPIPDTGNAFSFGSRSLDTVFGGITKGGTFSFEYDERVPYTAIRMVEVTSVINALNVGHSALMVTLPGAALENVASLIKPFVSPEAFRNRLAIASMTNKGGLQPPLYGLGYDNVKDVAVGISDLIERMRTNAKREGVYVIESVDQLESTFASNANQVLEVLAQRGANIQAKPIDALVLLIERSDSSLKTRVLSMSNRYARMLVKDRAVVVLGEKPATEAFVMEHSETNSLIPKLTKIV